MCSAELWAKFNPISGMEHRLEPGFSPEANAALSRAMGPEDLRGVHAGQAPSLAEGLDRVSVNDDDLSGVHLGPFPALSPTTRTDWQCNRPG